MEKTATRFRTFSVKYLGPTNVRGARYKITDLRRNKSITKPYEYEFNSVSDMAEAYLESIGIKIDGLAMCDKDCFLLSENFDIELA